MQMGGMEMGGLQWLLDIALIGLLAATLFHAMRLERALGVLKRDRAALEELVRAFNASTHQAEAGVERLRGAVDGAGRQIASQIEAAGVLKADLTFLNERGEQLADRLDRLVRSGQKRAAETSRHGENDYLQIPTDRTEYPRASENWPSPPRAVMEAADRPRPWPEPEGQPRPRMEAADQTLARSDSGDQTRLRSQAERDLMKALRLSR